MTPRLDNAGEEGLRFFGEVSASISHEIRNALAVINENAGLLKDFCDLAEKGKPIDQERFTLLAAKVLDQVRRADDIVRTLNQFAHSIDDPLKRVDLAHLVDFVVKLSHRTASMHGISLRVDPCSSPILIVTRPFLAQNVIWLCLGYAMDVCGDGESLRVTVESTDQGGCVRFTGLKTTADHGKHFPSEREKALLDVVSGEISTNDDAGHLALCLRQLAEP
jgi:signal transduction histidine kinase